METINRKSYQYHLPSWSQSVREEAHTKDFSSVKETQPTLDEHNVNNTYDLAQSLSNWIFEPIPNEVSWKIAGYLNNRC
ncbi:MAG: hypothetical protein K0R08_312 [Solimicrobium sp.]|jgi:hypothetical protein|nr:hypothetical protein [Solimicrobium sp.]